MTYRDKILSVIQSSIKTNKEKESVGAGGWIGAAVAGLLVMIITAVFGFIAWKNGRELSKLKIEKALAEEEEHQERVDSSLLKLETARNDALARADSVKKKIEDLEEKRLQVERDYNEATERISGITNWDDVDALLRLAK